MTDGQWARIVGDGKAKTSIMPYGTGSWSSIRGNAGIKAKPTSGVFAILYSKLGLRFDFPTVKMWEIAARAGSTDIHQGGSASAKLNYAWLTDNNGKALKPCGTRLPNSWGLYDVIGNVWEQTLDAWDSSTDLALLQTNPLVPFTSGVQTRMELRGGGNNTSSGDVYSTYSCRSPAGWHHNTSSYHVGFRISFIPETL